MKIVKTLPAFLLLSLLLSGCETTDTSKQDYIMSESQQKSYLEKTKPPQSFGFDLIPVRNGISFAGRARQHPQHMCVAKMKQDNIPVVDVRGKARRNNMNILIDASYPTSWIEFNTAKEFKVQYLGIDDQAIPYRGNYNTGGADAYAGVITHLRLDTLFIENVPFYVRMAVGSLGPLARGIQSPKVDAILGYDNLRTFEFIQFDLQNNRIIFSASIPYTPKENLLMSKAKIVDLPGFGLAVEGAIFDQKMPILLDFVGNYSFARGDVKVNITKQVSLGDLVMRQVPTLVLPSHKAPPRVGRKLLKPYVVTICNNEGVVYFERPSEK
jgi:hypothetical protein